MFLPFEGTYIIFPTNPIEFFYGNAIQQVPSSSMDKKVAGVLGSSLLHLPKIDFGSSEDEQIAGRDCS